MPAEQAVNPLTQLPIIPYVLIFLIFYFLLIKPQKKEQKEKKSLLESLKKNDKVVTTSGIHGTVAIVKDKTVVVRVDEKVRIEFDKEAVTTIIKSAEVVQKTT